MSKGPKIKAVRPLRAMQVLARHEVDLVRKVGEGSLHELIRRCTLAVLNSGVDIDDGRELLRRFEDYKIEIGSDDRGLILTLHNPPAPAFVDGVIIEGIRDQLFAVLRDLVYVDQQIKTNRHIGLTDSDGITNAIFHILRNAGLLQPQLQPNLVVCWGGHSISRGEYEYTKEVGYELGLREMDIATGCGPGAMKGPMKGAAVGHAKQRHSPARYLGITEPGIIAAESPNPIVNELVILPDIEKRLEAFVRLAHTVIVFPGGAGTAEEILYLLGVLLHPKNQDIPFPLIFTAPKSSAYYFKLIDAFIANTLGAEAQKRYKIIIDDPAAVARYAHRGNQQVKRFRKEQSDTYYFNWHLHVAESFQQPFQVTHASMSELQLSYTDQPHVLAANLRRAFSGIVAGNIKPEGIAQIEQHGPFEFHGDPELLRMVDELLKNFAAHHRMKLPGTKYTPCYRIVS